MRRIFRSTSAALILALVMAGSVQAGPLRAHRKASAPDRPAVFFTGLQEWLASLWTSPTAGLSAIWEEEGSIMDPDGRPTGAEEPGQDEGSIMDPNG